jgi:hypothetical protein
LLFPMCSNQSSQHVTQVANVFVHQHVPNSSSLKAISFALSSTLVNSISRFCLVRKLVELEFVKHGIELCKVC